MDTNQKSKEAVILNGPGLIELISLLADPSYSTLSHNFSPKTFQFTIKIGDGKIPHNSSYRLDEMGGLSNMKDSDHKIKMVLLNSHWEEGHHYEGTYNFITRRGKGVLTSP